MFKLIKRTKDIGYRKTRIKDIGCRKVRIKDIENRLTKDYSVGYMIDYVIFNLNCRYPKVEKFLLNQIDLNYSSKKTVLRNIDYCYEYLFRMIKKRWVKAEKSILLDDFISYVYVKNIIKDRWIELEKVICNKVYFCTYLKDILKFNHD